MYKIPPQLNLGSRRDALSLGHSFISDPIVINSFSNQKLVVLKSHFDVLKYTKSDFDRFKIFFPSQLISSVRKRQAEFLAGRIVVKHGLELFGLTNSSVPIGDKRAPVWPEGIIGSISHSKETAICAIADKTFFKLVGIDQEAIIDENLGDISDQILTSGELSVLEDADLEFNKALTITFSAKESLFKALFPLVNEYFDFSAAKVTHIDTKLCTFKIELIETLTNHLTSGKVYTGQYSYKDKHITTLILD